MTTRVYFLDNLRTFLIFLVILYHAGFTYQSALASNWIVVDPSKSDSIGLVGLYIDVFVMAVMFFISGYFISNSLKNHSSWDFIKSKFRRIMVPWIVAVVTLIPAYKIIFLYSRGLPQEEWFTYFHTFQRAGTDLSFFANDPSQHWLWFLPILFLFQVLYMALSKTNVFSINISLKTAVLAILIIGVIYSMSLAIADLKGWALTPIFDFQRERLLVYFMFFLLGSLCSKLGVFDRPESNKGYFILSNVVLTIGISIYTVLAINFLLNMVYAERNYFFISQRIDGIAFYSSLMLLMLSFLHILVHIFRTRFNKKNNVMDQLNANSYNVYIIHMIVLGVIAMGLVNISLPVVIKFLTLTLMTFVGSNVLVYAYRKLFKRNIYLKLAGAAGLVISFITITHSESQGPSAVTDSGPVQSVTYSPGQDIGIHEAVIQGDLETVKRHISSGSNLDEAEPAGGSSPLITAATFGKTEIALVLIEAGVDVNFTNNDGSTALITAAFFCRQEIVEALLLNGADKSIQNNSGSDALASVSAPFESVIGIYDYFGTVLAPFGLVLDYDQIETTRPVLVEILQD